MCLEMCQPIYDPCYMLGQWGDKKHAKLYQKNMCFLISDTYGCILSINESMVIT